MAERVSVPRGRHAPPLEVRLGVQRTRLLEAAAQVFAERGYADASAEAISRAAGMSKATFYEHFSNKEDAIVALFEAAGTVVLEGMREAMASAPDRSEDRVRAGLRAFFSTVADHPEASQTLLVEIIGAGPRAMERRDATLEGFARVIDEENRRAHEGFGTPRLRSFEDAYAIVGAIVELTSRQLRLGRPADLHDLEPVIQRLILGILGESR